MLKYGERLEETVFFLLVLKLMRSWAREKKELRGSFEEVKEFTRSGVFGPYNYEELMRSLEGNEGFGRTDYFLVGKDFPSYIECQQKVDKAYWDERSSSLELQSGGAASSRLRSVRNTL
ncbi:hypothetical protein GH714_031647 [Hevea brasiliensis]|uniref:Uncharacterized protein n=1 Tax=Hevea brasiliensis TaxID=3981 RepID=A0A6A6LFU5_HEVBR|nr:hypothetical protein GH714_031647 [Hevea brasiliensis]